MSARLMVDGTTGEGSAPGASTAASALGFVGGRRSGVDVADAAAEVGMLRAEQAPTALPTRDGPHVGHPQTLQRDDTSTTRLTGALVGVLVPEHPAAADAQLAVDVPRIGLPGEALGLVVRAVEFTDAQADRL